MGIRKSNIVSASLPAGSYTLPVDATRSILEVSPNVLVGYGVGAAVIPVRQKYAVSTGVVNLYSDTEFVITSNASTLAALDDYLADWYAELNGSSMYWQASAPLSIPPATDFELSFLVRGARDAYEGLLEYSVTEHTWVRLLPSSQSSNIQGYDGTTYFGGIPQSELLVRDGSLRKLSFIREAGVLYVQVDNLPRELMRSSGVDSAWTIDRFAKFSSTYLQGVLADVKLSISNSVVLHVPLTKKYQGSVQLPVVGSIAMTLVGYNPNVWSKT